MDLARRKTAFIQLDDVPLPVDHIKINDYVDFVWDIDIHSPAGEKVGKPYTSPPLGPTRPTRNSHRLQEGGSRDVQPLGVPFAMLPEEANLKATVEAGGGRTIPQHASDLAKPTPYPPTIL